MDTKFQTSFIPKKTLLTSHASSDSVSAFFIVAAVIFLIALAAAGGVFAYKKVLINHINAKNELLAKAKNAFESNLIDSVNVLNKRIEAAKRLVASHAVVLPLFELLENETLANVKFTGFSYELRDNGAALSLSGEAKNFNAIALQSDIFGQDKAIKNPIFSDLNPDQSGNITFKFSSTLDPSLTSYTSAYKLGVKAN